MYLFGLIGYPLSHSLSERIFNKKFATEGLKDHHYCLFPLKNIRELPELIKLFPELHGLNVTIPYKEAVIPYLDELDPVASDIGAINTIRIIRDKRNVKLIGYNTDYIGFQKTISKFLSPHHKNALILGTGGAAKAAAYVFTKLDIKLLFISRNPVSKNQISYSQAEGSVIRNHQIIVNATPLGMFPDVESFPDLPYEYLTREHLVLDLVYNPQRTVFLRKAALQGAVTVNGLEMLRLQADEAFRIFIWPTT
ncbi:MAG: shikimate dehydrogenase [Bacteroidetes bacterium]|nr:shikimate dehydrogenase [Bacteroidota bacterium]